MYFYFNMLSLSSILIPNPIVKSVCQDAWSSILQQLSYDAREKIIILHL
jgi:hypothetical protein